MGSSVNQHFVPQYHFRNFSSNGKSIHVFLTRHGRSILNAAISGQCAKRNFYGHAEIESAFAALEQRHALAIRRLLDFYRGRSRSPLSMDDQIHLMHAVLFQRSRTEFEVDKHKGSHEQFALAAFRAHLASREDLDEKDRMLETLDTGQFTLSASPQYVLGHLIPIAMQSVELIADLKLIVLKNFTQFPFIFSDSPVVFYNTYYRRITNRGVLGLQTPGLQIFFPLSPTIVLMLVDPSVYEIATTTPGCTHVVHPCDVSQLNALQLHHNSNAVYFKSAQDEGYVNKLWRTHNPNVQSVASIFRRLSESNLVCRGVADASQVLHTFEPQVNHELSLSFIRCNQVNPDDYQFSRRDPEFVKEYQKRMKKEDREQRDRIRRSGAPRKRCGA